MVLKVWLGNLLGSLRSFSGGPTYQSYFYNNTNISLAILTLILKCMVFSRGIILCGGDFIAGTVDGMCAFVYSVFEKFVLILNYQ